ncbi:hypothetical protein KJ570_04060 [Patescibacteria group bacterium]|nr:hypothetical protein [Patescibacteria group bacterium]MBU2036414.1 hypothetical protein [Patescibacteria group bacterium]
MKSFIKNIPYYTPLIGIFVAGALGFALFSYDRIFQVAIAIAVALSYVIWGIIHHSLEKDLYWEVVVEYLVVASLGLVILFSLIFRA